MHKLIIFTLTNVSFSQLRVEMKRINIISLEVDINSNETYESAQKYQSMAGDIV